VKFRRGEKPGFATTPDAEVRVTDRIEGAQEFQFPLGKEGPVMHHLRVEDAKSGEVFAEMTYAVDLSRKRGCGLNSKNAIDVDTFALNALDIPIQIPKWEQERRSRALLKSW